MRCRPLVGVHAEYPKAGGLARAVVLRVLIRASAAQAQQTNAGSGGLYDADRFFPLCISDEGSGRTVLLGITF